MGSDSLMWHRLQANERRVLLTVASMHKELGADARFHADAIEFVAGEPIVAELGLLTMFKLLDRFPEEGGKFSYLLTGEGFAVIPDSDEKRALSEHRAEADQRLREGKDA